MAELPWGSPAVRAAVAGAALDAGGIDVVALAEALTARPDLGGSRVVGRLGLTTTDFHGWLHSIPAEHRRIPLDSLVEVHEAFASRGGPPATTGGILGELLLVEANSSAGGFGRLVREEFHLSRGALLQAVRAVGPSALAELATVIAPLAVESAPMPARRQDEVLLPYSIGLETILERAAATARRKGEESVSSGVLMAAVHAQTMTADWSRCCTAWASAPNSWARKPPVPRPKPTGASFT